MTDLELELLSTLAVAGARPVIWGGHPNRDRWIGSLEDLRVAELERRQTAALVALGRLARDLEGAFRDLRERVRIAAVDFARAVARFEETQP